MIMIVIPLPFDDGHPWQMIQLLNSSARPNFDHLYNFDHPENFDHPHYVSVARGEQPGAQTAQCHSLPSKVVTIPDIHHHCHHSQDLQISTKF